MASSGEQTIGSSCMLKLVLMSEGMPVSAWYSRQDPVEARVGRRRDELRPRRAVDVHGGGRRRRFIFSRAVERQRHELRGVLAAVDVRCSTRAGARTASPARTA